MVKNYSIEISGRNVHLETGRIAKQANGSVVGNVPVLEIYSPVFRCHQKSGSFISMEKTPRTKVKNKRRETVLEILRIITIEDNLA